jgi:hypothetical protein
MEAFRAFLNMRNFIMTMDHEITEKMSRMSMINLPINPACFIISKIDKSTTFLLVDINLALFPTTGGKEPSYPAQRSRNKCTKHNPLCNR